MSCDSEVAVIFWWQIPHAWKMQHSTGGVLKWLHRAHLFCWATERRQDGLNRLNVAFMTNADRDAFFINVTFRHWHSSVKHQRIWTHTFRDYAESDRNHLIFHVIISTWQMSFCENTPRLSCPSTGQTQVQSSKPTAHETEATLKGFFFLEYFRKKSINYELFWL